MRKKGELSRDISLTDREYQDLHRRAEKEGMNISKFIRKLLLGDDR